VLKIQGTQVNYVKIAFTDFGYKKNHLEKVVLCPEQARNLPAFDLEIYSTSTANFGFFSSANSFCLFLFIQKPFLFRFPFSKPKNVYLLRSLASANAKDLLKTNPQILFCD
jgi:hypothetical protein